MSKKIMDFKHELMKETLILSYRATCTRMIPFSSLRKLPITKMLCIKQYANIRLIIDSEQFPYSFCYWVLFWRIFKKILSYFI